MESIEPTHLFTKPGEQGTAFLSDIQGQLSNDWHNSSSQLINWFEVEPTLFSPKQGGGEEISNVQSSLDPLTGRDLRPSNFSPSSTLVFIDATVGDIETLIAGVQPGAEVVILDGNRDGIEQISETLAQRQGIESVQILSHGSAGQVRLGSGDLSSETLQRYASQLQQWQNALTENADILFYGCNLAADGTGMQFIEQLSHLTGADVAASNDLTGNSRLGGDWDLEVFTGTIESDLALQIWVQSAYRAVLDTTTDLQANAASYLGGVGDDSGTAVEIAPDNTILLAGTINGQGQVTRLASNGQTVLATYTVGSNVKDMDVNRSNGTITVVGDSGVTSLNSNGTVLWSQGLSGGTNTRRVAVAQDGTVAVLESNNSFSNQVTVFAATGMQLGSFAINQTAQDKSVDDIAIDSNTGSVFVAGFRQVASNLQLPLFRSYNYSGSVKWRNYEFSNSQALSKGDTADTRGLRVAMGRDGMLYYAGSLDGGTTVYRRNSQDINQNASYNVNIDNYTNTSNTNSGKFGYFARVNPSTGEVLKGQYAVNRLSSGRGNSFGINAITADESGQVFIGGSSAASVKHRDELKINGTAVGNYTNGEGAVIAISADFTSRELVAVWAGNGAVAASGVNGIAVGNGIRAIASTASGSMITVNPVQGTLGGGKDAFFSIWGNATTPTPTISISDVTVTEGDGGTLNAELTVSLSQNPTNDITVDFVTESGTATPGSDYEHQGGTLTFVPGGNLTQTIRIAITGDTDVEENETFFVNLSNESSNATIADTQGVGTILNNDSTPPTPPINPNDNNDSTPLTPDPTPPINPNTNNEMPIINGIANITVDPTVTPSVTVDGSAAFRDAGATADALVYSIAGNTNAELFNRPPTLHPATGEIDLDFHPQAVGTSEITLRGMDTSGLFIETMFKVQVDSQNSPSIERQGNSPHRLRIPQVETNNFTPNYTQSNFEISREVSEGNSLIGIESIESNGKLSPDETGIGFVPNLAVNFSSIFSQVSTQSGNLDLSGFLFKTFAKLSPEKITAIDPEILSALALVFLGHLGILSTRPLPQMSLKPRNWNDKKRKASVQSPIFPLTATTSEEFYGWDFTEIDENDLFGLQNPEDKLISQSSQLA
ncbi:DUF4347 domain-containing protein [Lusitaniella coriacea]|uniref:DUF4347 domain-containing protein n=1 Tax=Lusitaniella coriacea TaxID=1983105 RepID=UPI003CF40359